MLFKKSNLHLVPHSNLNPSRRSKHPINTSQNRSSIIVEIHFSKLIQIKWRQKSALTIVILSLLKKE
ncbi:hypothetical protein CH380_16595 [Leptospira adleri]|uniref:Uncharacterized protein n=1 Tax=Leptospira adleri TaxID=2023186 RepID=A0A2M9YKJ3_9LEPT|nr:hypothetical protein CH380_16595 [Leptospira adleri]PJZ62921.1 hypothetical protein CH376_05375 [Leptospira adleri]